MRPSTLPSSNWVLYWGRPISSSHPWRTGRKWNYRKTAGHFFHVSRLEPSRPALTRHPVVVQLSLVILLLRAKGLQSQLQLLLVQWVFDAQLLHTATTQHVYCTVCLKCLTIESTVCLRLLLRSPAWAHPLEVLLGGLQERLARRDPHAGHVHVQAEALLLQPVAHLVLRPTRKWSINITAEKK